MRESKYKANHGDTLCDDRTWIKIEGENVSLGRLPPLKSQKVQQTEQMHGNSAATSGIPTWLDRSFPVRASYLRNMTYFSAADGAILRSRFCPSS
jgi:hypothetical protein